MDVFYIVVRPPTLRSTCLWLKDLEGISLISKTANVRRESFAGKEREISPITLLRVERGKPRRRGGRDGTDRAMFIRSYATSLPGIKGQSVCAIGPIGKSGRSTWLQLSFSIAFYRFSSINSIIQLTILFYRIRIWPIWRNALFTQYAFHLSNRKKSFLILYIYHIYFIYIYIIL